MLLEKSFDTGEVIINYVEGPENGPPLVLLHGSTQHWQIFQLTELITKLAPTWHVYACDLRGHGKSGWATSGYRVVDFVRDITAFVQGHIGQPTVLVGFSTGALVALGVAAQVPELVRAIVLLDPPLMHRDSSIQSASPYEWFTWVYETVKSPRPIEEVAARCKDFMPELDEAEVQRYTMMIRGLDPQSVAVLLDDQFFAGLDLERVLPQVACPAFLLYGEQDRGSLVREADVEFIEAHVAHSVVIQIRDAGHGLLREQPERVLDHITRFLNSL